MRRELMAFAGVIAMVVASSAMAPAMAAQAVESRDVGELLAETVAKYELPAMAAAVVEADGTITALGVAGVRSRGSEGRGAPVTVEDLWHIGSCTKSMTASLCAALVEEGLLRWDQTLGETFAGVEMSAGYRAITLEQLLTNRAGTPEGIGSARLWSALWGHQGTPTEARLLLLEGVATGEPAFAPGSRYAYSNFGFAIAGHMCEEVAGEPYEQLLIEKLLAPMGITTAGFGAPGLPPGSGGGEAGQAPDQPRGHAGGKGIPPGPNADNPPAISPAGRVHLSMGDWAKYIAWHLRGAARARGEEIAGGAGPNLSAASFRRLHTPPDGSEYAMGWGIAERGWAGGAALTHSGSNTMWFCVVWAAPAKGFAVLVATNEGGDAAAKGCDDAAGALIRLRQQREGAEAPAGN
jgi:CubicO group peptidase (beta-lactamase class C family)